MKIRVLGCSGAIAKGCRTTSFLIDEDTLIDAGTGVGDLTLAEMQKIDRVFLTHSHLDHVAALPLMVDSVGSLRSRPLEIHALAETLEALKQHVFNGVIWPDFSQIPSKEAPFVRFHSVVVGQVLDFGDKAIEVLPAVHTVPAVGYAASGGQGHWVFTGDTGRNPALWARLKAMRVAMLVIETAFSNQEIELARRTRHLSPADLAEELAQIDPGQRFPVYITHTKPAETVLIMSEIQQAQVNADNEIHWLHAGQEFSL